MKLKSTPYEMMMEDLTQANRLMKRIFILMHSHECRKYFAKCGSDNGETIYDYDDDKNISIFHNFK